MKNALIGIVAGFVNGLLGSGGGTIVVPALEFFQKLDEYRSHATAIAVILPLSIVSTVIYFFKGSLEWKSILIVGAGSIIGSAIGAYLLKKVSPGFLSKLFGVVMVAASVRMMFT